VGIEAADGQLPPHLTLSGERRESLACSEMREPCAGRRTALKAVLSLRRRQPTERTDHCFMHTLRDRRAYSPDAEDAAACAGRRRSRELLIDAPQHAIPIAIATSVALSPPHHPSTVLVCWETSPDR
jgi:hypothetical protein